ncbi:aldehyde dehydrogenase (NADP(+)) [Pseudoalteromonas denitrificans]|uniref:NADP-dependent aldehyde dehydrogenase n=1 Tax=Pseudoalteromonas denitrificans DSM 6059 TaxID=1123010 RepID=A0A1I1EI50_9GAMM|nr:aldehyde dehydrogenase (NADP(+)) [Pseudoalteromonas denitrificans]SFB86829.1 NADP-dependent aldehyde dehydrogenase [Pseudoalteromonas denitrificans DSM 6059]
MLSGLCFIGGQWQADTEDTFNAINATDHTKLSTEFVNCSDSQLINACELAEEAFFIYRKKSVQQRADFINEIAEQLVRVEGLLLELTTLETGLPEARIQGELGRTVNQLRLFANNITKDSTEIAHDVALPERAPLPRPELKLGQLPLGPVAVFGASNFPLAFSTAGGDTASALAAGCPVIFKSHSAHPGTCEIVTKAIEIAINNCEMPKGVFALIHSKAYEISHSLVKNPKIKAVGFTGSYRVGMALQESIYKRKEPIPFYGELGSVNPQLILPGFITDGADVVAQEFVTSMNMGCGQFCTNPGLWLVSESEQALFEKALTNKIQSSPAQTMLTPAMLTAYQLGCEKLNVEVTLLAKGLVEDKKATTHLFVTSAEAFIKNDKLSDEVFGPASLIVTYKDLEQAAQLISIIDGQLTASVHGSNQVINENKALIEVLSYKVGRLIFNQMPTGVEVSDAMMHGGPFPCSTDIRSTSVGSQAIQRFLRPICYQNSPI